MEQDSNFAKYTPQHPLPQAIQTMTRDDTVCQYCGVSYLIHNEIKRLEEKLAKCNEELDQQRGWKKEKQDLQDRIKFLEKSLSQMESELKEERRSKSFLEQLMVSKEKDFVIISEKTVDLENNLNKEKTRYGQLVCKFESYSSVIGAVKGLLPKINDEIRSWHQLVINMPCIIDQYQGAIMKNIKALIEAEDHEKGQLTRKVETLTEKNKDYFIMLNGMETEVSKYKEQVNILCSDREKVKKLQEELEDCKKSLSRCEDDNSQKENQLNKMAQHLCHKENMLERSKEEFKEESKRMEHLSLKHLQNLEEKEMQLRNVTNTCKELEEKLEVYEKSGSQVQKLLTESENKAKGLKNLVSKLQQDVQELKTERQQMIDAHQNRIQQLRESYFEKLQEAAGWPDRLKDELKQQQEKFDKEQGKLREELEEAHRKDIEGLTSKLHGEHEKALDEKMAAIRKLQMQLTEAETRWRTEQKKADDAFSKEREASASVIKDQLAMISHLDETIKTLKEQPRSRSEEENLDACKKRCIQTESALQLANAELARLEQELTDAKRELFTLHETVRRECEERLELTDSLAQARTQLLGYLRGSPSSAVHGNDCKSFLMNHTQGSPSSSRTSMQALYSQSNRGHDRCSKTSNAASEQESRQRIASAIQRVRSSSKKSLYEGM